MTVRRAFVLLASLLALAVAADEASRGAELFGVIGKALGAAAAAISVGAMAERLWQGAVVAEARLPGGVGIGFETQEAELGAIRTELSELELRLALRLIRLEREVYGTDEGGNGRGVR